MIYSFRKKNFFSVESQNPQYLRQPIPNQQSLEQQQNSRQTGPNNRAYSTAQMSMVNPMANSQTANHVQGSSSLSATLNQPIRASLNQQMRLPSNPQTMVNTHSSPMNTQNTVHTNTPIRLRESSLFQRGSYKHQSIHDNH